MRAVDTNLVVRLIARDEPKQVAAAETFVRSGAWMSTLVLQETLWVLERAYRLERRALAKVVELLLDHETLALEAPDVVRQALQEFEMSTTVGFSDCLILATARARGHVPLGSFDKRLSKLSDVELAR